MRVWCVFDAYINIFSDVAEIGNFMTKFDVQNDCSYKYLYKMIKIIPKLYKMIYNYKELYKMITIIKIYTKRLN